MSLLRFPASALLAVTLLFTTMACEEERPPEGSPTGEVEGDEPGQADPGDTKPGDTEEATEGDGNPVGAEEDAGRPGREQAFRTEP